MATEAGAGRQDTYSVLRPRKSRAKTGCFTCRNRRKKCDEQRPICHSCNRLQLDCSWPDRIAERTSLLANQSHPTHLNVDTVDLLDTSGPALIAELQYIGQDLVELGVFPYTAGLASTIRDQILTLKGPDAAMLFDHFCHRTAPWLVNGNDHDNPVLTHIVPLAKEDDLVLRTILAMSAAHLEHSKPAAVATATKYYLDALYSLKQRLSEWLNRPSKDYRALLSTTILLCHCEFIHAISYGTALQHLRACREFVNIALERLHTPDQDFIVFLIEHYGYLMVIANMRGSLHEENIKLGLDFSASILPLIKNLPSFGSIFAYEPEVFSLIPQIAQLAWQIKESPDYGNSEVCRDKYLTLLDTLNLSYGLYTTSNQVDSANADKKSIVMTIKINALQIYLHSSFHGRDRNRGWITELVRPLIDRPIELLQYVEESDFCYGLNWSILMMGSYIVDHNQQELLVRRLEANKSRMPFVRRGVELLRWLWSDSDDTAFGLTGLEKAARDHDVDLCIC